MPSKDHLATYKINDAAADSSKDITVAEPNSVVSRRSIEDLIKAAA